MDRSKNVRINPRYIVATLLKNCIFKGNPFVKQEIWTWLSEVLSDGKGLPKEELIACLTPLYAGVEDRLVL